MKKLSAVAIVTTAEGERVSYTYTELDSDGNITSQNIADARRVIARIAIDLSERGIITLDTGEGTE